MDGNKTWLKQYPENIPVEIALDPKQTIVSMFEEVCARYPKRVAFRCQGSALTYAELHARALQFASYCQHGLKLKPGERLAIMLPNILQYPIVLFGTLMAGLVVVNINPLDKAPSIKYELCHSGAKAIVVLDAFISELQQIVQETDVQEVILATIGGMYPPFKRFAINFAVKYIKRMVPKWYLPNCKRLRREALVEGSQRHFKPVPVTADQLAFVQYTGGTTGSPKGVMLTHANVMANVQQCVTWIKPYINTEREALITALPLYHIFSLVANCLVFTSLGYENVLVPNPRDIPGFVRLLKKTDFTGMTGVNTLFNALLNHPKFQTIDFSRLHITLGGGMAVMPAVAEAWYRATGCVLCQGYGMTEASPVVSINYLDRPFNGSVGLPLPNTEVSIHHLDDPLKRCAVDEYGEIWVKGPQVMRGYWQDDIATRQVLQDGWLRTGDVGYLDAEGFLYIVDRIKDIINVSGFKVCSVIVEKTISELPGILEVAVIAEPDPEHGEVVKACVVLKPGATLTEQDIMHYCRQKLAAYKAPRVVRFYPSLPKSPVGKILKKALREDPDAKSTFCHRESGDPVKSSPCLDSGLRGNDTKKSEE